MNSNQESYFSDIPWELHGIKKGILFLLIIFCLFQSYLFLPKELSSAFFFSTLLLLLFFGEFPLLLITWFLALRKVKGSYKFLGFRKFQSNMLLLGFILVVFQRIFTIIYGLVLELFNLQLRSVDVTIVLEFISTHWLFFLGHALIAPVTEEIFFRGFLFGGLVKHYGWKKSAIISSLLFALLHITVYTPYVFIPMFVVGILLSYLYYRSKSIIPGIVFHCLNNLLVYLAAYKSIISATY